MDYYIVGHSYRPLCHLRELLLTLMYSAAGLLSMRVYVVPWLAIQTTLDILVSGGLLVRENPE